ncbi:hypothetical protein P775_00960 [Puniceibacterium antarcticum]|uniref:Uncharacterized protein n=1 Tax=Puniceibacterium antarcticum TaxID=1206336 RepID=A0A2G8RKE1_9RHOB|nr:hypothetical protein [Puniceibacterium antarcticum]PIL22066.1 hypothetical protein P775_00960 [Puniceibacterium antarcticum]
MSKVYIFNAAPISLYMTVNNGPKRFTVAECDSTSWAPGVPAAADLPVFTGSASGAPGEFKVGVNSVEITPTSGGGQSSVSITIPTSVNPRDELQIYIFWASTTSVSWMLLSDGAPIQGSFVIP